MIREKPYAAWLASLLTFGLAGSIVVALTHDEFLDCSNPQTHESANTPLGWSMAVMATVIPAIVGVTIGLAASRRLIGVSIAVAALQAVIWTWALTPTGNCESASAIKACFASL